MKQDRNLRQHLEYIQSLGFEVVAVKRGKHWKVAVRPNYTFVFGVTPGDRRAFLNFQAQARNTWRELKSQPETVTLSSNDPP